VALLVVCSAAEQHDDLPSTGPELTGLGSSLLSKGHVQDALRCFRKAALLFPTVPLAWYNVGVAAKRGGLYEEAARAYQAYAELQPLDPEGHHRLASALIRLGREEQAWEAFKQAAAAHALNPKQETQQHLSEASALAVSLKHFSEGRRILALALRLDASDHLALVAMGQLLMGRNKHAEAVPFLLRAVRAVGLGGGEEQVQAVCMLLLSLQRSALWGRFLGTLHSQHAYRRMLSRLIAARGGSVKGCTSPTHALEIPLSAQHTLELAGLAAADAEGHVRQTKAAWTTRINWGLYDDIDDDAANKDPSLMAMLPSSVNAWWMRQHEHARPRRRRVRVGYVSGTGFQEFTTTALFISALLARHDPATTAVACYAWMPDDGSSLRAGIAGACARFVDLHRADHSHAAELVNSDGVQVLVDLTGLTLNPRLELLALRPAEVQLHWHGYPGSVATPLVDAWAGDAVSSPPELASLFSERLLLLPLPYLANSHPHQRPLPLSCPSSSSSSYAAAGQPPKGVSRQSLFGDKVGEDHTLLAVFSQAYKIDEATLRVWVHALQASNSTKLWILRHNSASQAPLLLAARKLGLEGGEERMLFTDLLARGSELPAKALADALLDTPLFGCHTTGVDGLWAGLPIITAPAESLPSRVAASLAMGGGSTATVARNLEDYAHVLGAMLRRPAAARRVREQVLRSRGVECGDGARGERKDEEAGKREEDLGPIWRTTEFVRAWERGLRLAWELQRERGEQEGAEWRRMHVVVAAAKSDSLSRDLRVIVDRIAL